MRTFFIPVFLVFGLTFALSGRTPSYCNPRGAWAVGQQDARARDVFKSGRAKAGDCTGDFSTTEFLQNYMSGYRGEINVDSEGLKEAYGKGFHWPNSVLRQT